MVTQMLLMHEIFTDSLKHYTYNSACSMHGWLINRCTVCKFHRTEGSIDHSDCLEIMIKKKGFRSITCTDSLWVDLVVDGSVPALCVVWRKM